MRKHQPGDLVVCPKSNMTSFHTILILEKMVGNHHTILFTDQEGHMCVTRWHDVSLTALVRRTDVVVLWRKRGP